MARRALLLAGRQPRSAGFRWGYWAAALGAALFVFAAGWGMRGDLPDSRFSTEQEAIYLALKFGSGDLNPHSFYHPAFFSYVLFALYGAAFVVGRLAGFFHSVADYERLFFIDPTLFYLLARGLVILIALGGFALFYDLGRRLYKSVETALLATALLSSSFLYMASAHYASTDIPMMALCLFALWRIERVLSGGGLRDHVLAGLCVGLATATKYNAGWLAVALVLTHALGARKSPRLLAAGLAAAAAGFACASPFTLLDARKALAAVHLLSHDMVVSSIHFDTFRAKGSGFGYLMTSVFPNALGRPLTLASLLGTAYALWRREKADLLLCGFALSYCLFVGHWSVIMGRYFIHILPVFVLLAARFLSRAGSRLDSRVRVLALLLVWAGLSAPSWARIAAFDRLAAQAPAGLSARRWIESNLPQGSGVATLSGVELFPNQKSIDRQLEESRAKNIGEGARLKKLARYASALTTFDLYDLPYPWRADFDAAKFDFERLRAAGVRYFILTDEADQYDAAPQKFPAQAAYVSEVRRRCRLIKEVRQQEPSFDDPAQSKVLIYELAQEGKLPNSAAVRKSAR